MISDYAKLKKMIKKGKMYVFMSCDDDKPPFIN